MKRHDLPPVSLNDFTLTPSHSAYSPESDQILPPPQASLHTDHSLDSDFWGQHSNQSHSPSSVSVSPTIPPPPSAPSAPPPPPADPPKPKKSRREKPRIELAPDQPPTTQGKPRERVYVACIQCRTRKIRCDGAKPTCHNCSRRTTGNNDCTYDSVPKRRGPDKCPGARQRSARGANGEVVGPRRRRRTTRSDTTASNSDTNANTISKQAPAVEPLVQALPQSPLDPGPHPINAHANQPHPEQPSHSVPDFVKPYPPECGCHGLVDCPDLLGGYSLTDSRKSSAMPSPTYDYPFDHFSMMPPHPHVETRGGYITEIDENGEECAHQQRQEIDIGSQPSLNFTRKVWWDSLLSLYASSNPFHLRAISASERETISHKIGADLRWIFRASNYWFSFFHLPTFFGNFYDPHKRERMQPSLVLALLAISTFFQSSEVGNGQGGRERALRFRDEAQGALEASFNSGWIDETLAQAAWLLALFEVCAHPSHSSERSGSSMLMLDSLIRSLSLTLVDADDPNTTLFPPGSVPVVSQPHRRLTQVSGNRLWYPDQPTVPDLSYPAHNVSHPEPSGCTCQSMTLGENWSSANDLVPMWGSTPAWGEGWSEADLRKESIRRLCWSSMILAAGHISYTMAHRQTGLDLFISDPANYALLFSGESVARSPSLSGQQSSKDTVWALFDRAFLLWHGCIRMRNNARASDTDKAQFAVKAWIEADALEQALNKHTCAIERAFIFQAREYIFNTRMCISYEFRRFVPLVSANVDSLFHRTKAEEWLSHQATVAQRFMLGLHTITGNANNLLARRPFFVFWFMGQIGRALALWQCDNSLTVALDVCKALLPAIDYLTALWPCLEQRLRYDALRDKLEQACYTAGISPPPPPNLTLPLPSTPEALV
ncbi:hypothetical protein CC1G_02915 [Coprinopsis cinerea okayama7|uniref:Zn(2)-C6 fungal-type domain-containing protein n=1 Tax=Coprinopsis cinerea (strain Okayama-7 / 130 / ATCC MYA-4618 / FGSC 9003) TaxID=240176 RepID=A8NRQ1_COPC7|nr:hypothetical protein CC1G_02915 [Coprinopsis cinerea okayama7\|eukprot:XP_001835827.2 hypothetical protein CC1G_02915 [Coprinopsis cinerea okayama7\